MGWYHILYQVGIFAIVVVGVRRPVVPPSLQTYHETVAAEKFDEGISAWHAACLLGQLLDYQVQFGASQAGIVLPVFLDLLHDKRLYRVVREVRVIPFVVWLSAVTKQPAQPNTSVSRDFGDPTASWSEVNGETTVGRDGSGDVRVVAGGFVRVDAVTEDI